MLTCSAHVRFATPPYVCIYTNVYMFIVVWSCTSGNMTCNGLFHKFLLILLLTGLKKETSLSTSKFVLVKTLSKNYQLQINAPITKKQSCEFRGLGIFFYDNIAYYNMSVANSTFFLYTYSEARIDQTWMNRRCNLNRTDLPISVQSLFYNI